MAVFAVYKYFFERGEKNILNEHVDVENSFAHAQEIFTDLFPTCGTMKIPHTNTSGENTIYNADIQVHKNNIIIITLQNEKSKEIMTINYGIEYHKHYPFCHIIIDNRPGVGQIMIERSAAFGHKTSTIYNIIFPYLKNKLLDDHQLTFDMNMKFKEDDFWEVINRRKIRFNDPVKSVKFIFDNPKTKKPVDASADMAESMIAMASIAQADKAELLLNANTENELEISRTNKHLANLVKLCSNNTYSVSVGFKHHGLYEYGTKERAMVIMSDMSIIDEYISTQTTINDEVRLVLWLDAIRNQTADYEV